MTTTISVCKAADLEALAELVNAAYRGLDGQAGWTSEIDMVAGPRTTAATLAAEFDSSRDVTILGLRETGALLACIRLEKTADAQGKPACLIGMLAVRPGLQDRGLGRMMLERAEAEALGWGAGTARMTVVSVRDSLIAWYERRGYRRTGETEAFPYDDDRFGTPMRPDLAFVVLEKALLDKPAAELHAAG
ncbi:MAG: GNAT family N-acetyltransferase [Aliidongia sp.]